MRSPMRIIACIRVWGLVYAFSVGAVAWTQPTNLWENPGFEANPPDLVSSTQPPPGWNWTLRTATGSVAVLALDTNVVHSGARSFKIEVKEKPSWLRLGPKTSFPVLPGKKYAFSLWLRTATQSPEGFRLSSAEVQINTSSYLCVEGLRSDRTAAYIYAIQFDFGVIDGKHTYMQENIQASNSWSQYTFTQVVPAKATNAYVSMDAGQVGTLWVDDAEFKEVPNLLDQGMISAVFSGQGDSQLAFPLYRADVHTPRSGYIVVRLATPDNMPILSLEMRSLLEHSDYINLRDEAGQKVFTVRTADPEKGYYQGTVTFTSHKVVVATEWKIKDVKASGMGMTLNPDFFKGNRFIARMDNNAVQTSDLPDPLPDQYLTLIGSIGSAVQKALFYLPGGKLRLDFGSQNLQAKDFRAVWTPPSNTYWGLGFSGRLEVLDGNKPCRCTYEIEYYEE